MSSAFRGEIVVAGRTGAVSPVGDGMVEVAVGGGLPAGGKGADLISSAHIVGERGRRSVAVSPDIDDFAGRGAGADALPGAVGGQPARELGRDRPVSHQFGRGR